MLTEMIFRMIGTLTFTGDALKQLNELVVQLFNVCGIRWYLLLSTKMWIALAAILKDIKGHVVDAGEYTEAETAELLEILCTYFGIESIDMRLIRTLAEGKNSPSIRSAVHVLAMYIKEDAMRFPEFNEEYAYRFSEKYCSVQRKMKIYGMLCLMTEKDVLQKWDDKEGR